MNILCKYEKQIQSHQGKVDHVDAFNLGLGLMIIKDGGSSVDIRKQRAMARTRQLLQHFQISRKLETSPEQLRYVSWRRLCIFPIVICGCETWIVGKADTWFKS